MLSSGELFTPDAVSIRGEEIDGAKPQEGKQTLAFWGAAGEGLMAARRIAARHIVAFLS